MLNNLELVRGLLSTDVFRFLVVGFFNTLFSYSVFLILIFMGIYYILASFLSYFVAILGSYWLNKKWVFKSEKKSLSTFFGFVMINSISLTLGLLSIFLLVDVIGVDVLLSQVFCIFISMAVNFVSYKVLF